MVELVFISFLFASTPDLVESDLPTSPGLVVLSLSPGTGISDDLAHVLSDVLLVNLRQSGAFGAITSSADLQSLLDLEQQKTVMGCDDESCLAEIGGMLGVPYLLRSQVGKVGPRYVVTLHLVGVDAVRVVARSMSQVDSEGDLTTAIAQVVPQLVRDFKAQDQPKDIVASLLQPLKYPRRPWIARSGYGLTGLGVGLLGWGWIVSNAAQAKLSPGPTVVTAREVNLGQAEIARANGFAWLGGTLGITGLGLVVWGSWH